MNKLKEVKMITASSAVNITEDAENYWKRHVNNFIHSEARQGKRMTYLKDIPLQFIPDIKDELQLAGFIVLCPTSDMLDVYW